MTRTNRNLLKRFSKTKRAVVRRIDLQRAALSMLLVVTVLSILFSVKLLASQKTTSETIDRLPRSGEFVRLGNLEINASNVRHTTDYIPSLEPQTGQKLLQLHLVTINRGNEAKNFFPSINTYIRDSEGISYQMSPAVITDPFVAGSIPSGGALAGDLSYMVTDRQVPLWLVVEDLEGGARSAVIKIQD